MPRVLRTPSFGRRKGGGKHVRLQEGTLGPLYDPDSPGVELGGGGAVGSFEVGPRLDRLLSEQATLTQIMRGFDQQLTAGVDGDQLLTSREFQEALTRLSGAQRELSSCLGAARERIVRDYPMLLSQSRAAAWLLRLVWSCLGASGPRDGPGHRAAALRRCPRATGPGPPGLASPETPPIPPLPT